MRGRQEVNACGRKRREEAEVFTLVLQQAKDPFQKAGLRHNLVVEKTFIHFHVNWQKSKQSFVKVSRV